MCIVQSDLFEDVVPTVRCLHSNCSHFTDTIYRCAHLNCVSVYIANQRWFNRQNEPMFIFPTHLDPEILFILLTSKK